MSQFIPQIWLNHFNFNLTRNGILLEIEYSRIKKSDQHVFIIMCKEFNELPRNLRDCIGTNDFLKDVKLFLTQGTD